jgi:hypothetical protein
MPAIQSPDPAPSTDEWIDRHLSRPVAAVLVRLVARTPMTANQITAVAGAVGVASGIGLARATPLSLGLAAAGIVAYLVLDCADGQLARLRGGGSRGGRLLDGACDYVCALSLHVGAVIGLIRTAHPDLPALPTGVEVSIVVLAGMLLAVRAGVYDDLKGRVRSLSGAAPDERDDPDAIRAEIEAERRPHVRFFLRAYLLYCRMQSTPASVETPATGEALRRHVRALRAWSVLGPSTALFALAVACALAIRWPDAIRWYFLLTVGAGTLLMVALWPLVARVRRR